MTCRNLKWKLAARLLDYFDMSEAYAVEIAAHLVPTVEEYVEEQEGRYSTGKASFAAVADKARDRGTERHPKPAEDGRRDVICELREFADDLYGITGARWIADALTSTLDRLSEDDK